MSKLPSTVMSLAIRDIVVVVNPPSTQTKGINVSF